jgi:hypothetical protein
LGTSLRRSLLVGRDRRKPTVSKAYRYLRLASDVKGFLREPISVEAAKAHVGQGMRSRDPAFLRMIERAIFGNPSSPYLELFRAAGCEFGDVERLVRRHGIEETLHQLLKAGIYVTFDEFKGRAPAVRGSQTFAFHAADFDNPSTTAHFQSSSGGTRGQPTRIHIDLEHLAQSAPHWALWFAAHDWLPRPLVFWTPAHSGVANRHLFCAKFGKRFSKWFAIKFVGSMKERLIAAWVHGAVRRAARLPKPDFLPLSETGRVGEYLVRMTEEGQQPCVVTTPSAATRLGVAVQAQGRSLHNVAFLLGAEPLTRARRETIEAAGAEAVPTYGFAEGGSVGSQCPTPAAVDDVHISLDAYAVIQRARRLEDDDTVNALLLTALRPACPKVMLNAEIGDCGVLETRRCGCLFDEVGYFQHLHTIRSFEKLTGEGVTFIGSDFFHLLEETLPKKFGGSVGDYQLVEEQDDRGRPHCSVLVSPEVGALDEKELVATVLKEMGRGRDGRRLMAHHWAQADILQVRRRQPVPTARGKVLPFRTLGPG